MSVTSDTRRQAQPTSGVAGWLASMRATMERPLTSYYLLLGATTMLLAIGLMMVLSASSVYSYRVHGNSYYIFLKQLTWVAIGLPAAWAASRMNRKVLRMLAWPAVLVAVVLLALTQTSLGFAVNGNRNWLAFGPVDGAALGDRQALDHPVGGRRLREEGAAARQPAGTRSSRSRPSSR